MPFVTFLNHDKDGKPYDRKKDSISVHGKFSDEVFAAYNEGDVLEFARNYGFIADTKFAYSLAMRISTQSGSQIIINRSPASTLSPEGFQLPLINKNRNTITVSWFPLYFQNGPRYPARIAQLIANEVGIPAVAILNDVFRSNLGVLIPVAFLLRESENPYAQLHAAAAQRQLELIGGARE